MRKMSICFVFLYFLITFTFRSTCALANTIQDYDDGYLYNLDYSAGTFDIDNTERIIPSGFNFAGVPCNLVLGANVRTTNGATVTVYTAEREFPQNIIEDFDDTTLNNYDVVLISPSSARYNCHSYAWYLTASTNTYCIIDISPYLNDPHCEEIESPTVGAIAVYYGSDGAPLHSAIVTAITGSSVICRSKWGPCGVYEHALHTVPSDYKANGQINVRYYTYERVHTNTYSHDGSAVYHTVTCTTCGYQTTKAHSFRITYNSTSHTRTCNQCGWSASEPHTFDSLTNKCITCGYNASGVPIQPTKGNPPKSTDKDVN